jgi:hypothetical protein
MGEVIPMNVSNMYVGAPAQNPTGLQLLASVTDGGGTASIDIQNIPYRKFLRIVCKFMGKSGADTISVQYNADTGANYNSKVHEDGGAAVSAVSQNSQLVFPKSSTLQAFSVIDINNKTASGATRQTQFVTYSASANAATAAFYMNGGGNWYSGDQINRVTFILAGANTFSAGSEISIYGSD